MDIQRERLTNIVQRIFGSDATLGGSMGNGKHPGVLTVMVGDRALGSGRTLQDALADSQRNFAERIGSR